MYSQDFAPADAFYEPAGDALSLGVPPLLIGLLLILLLAAGALGWWIGRRPARTADNRAEAIWKAIDAAIRSAMTAHSDGLADRAHALRRTVHEQLGKTLTVAAALAPLKALDTALGDETGDHHDDHAAHASDDHGAHGPATQVDASPPGIHIERADRVVIHQPARPPATPHAKPTPPPTEAQRRDAIRKAVSDLNDHWRLKDDRINEMKAAHAELSARRG